MTASIVCGVDQSVHARTVATFAAGGSPMNEVCRQTVRLSPGRHRSPDDGVCVMELASILAASDAKR